MMRQKMTALFCGAMLTVVLAAIQLYDPGLVSKLRDIGFDQMQVLQPRTHIVQPVRIVDIDDLSLAAQGQWPWPRNRIAELVDNLGRLGAAAIVFDIAFAEADRLSPSRIVSGEAAAATSQDLLPDYDAQLAEAAARAPVVFAFAVQRNENTARPAPKAGFVQAGSSAVPLVPQFHGASPLLEPLQDSATGIGSMSLAPETTADVIRRVPLLWSDGTSLYPGLALEGLRVALGETTYIVHSSSDAPGAVDSVSVGEFSIPTNARGEVWLHFRTESFDDYVSASRLIGQIDDDALRPLVEGHIVLIGTSAAGLLDLRTTPLSENVPGVAIHAQLLEQILTGDHLQRADWMQGLEALATLLTGFSLVYLVMFYGPVLSLLLGAIIAVLIAAASWFLFARAGILVDAGYTLAAGLLIHFAMTSFRYLFTDRQARIVRRAFSQYVSPAVLADIERAPENLVLGGEVRPLTILFMDVRNFTTLSETLSPQELVTFLNRLLGALSDCITSEGGTIDKYIGDSVMAFWNAPIAMADHPIRACRAALAMRARLKALNAEDAFGFRAQRRDLPPVEIGIGINTGQACVGNMGSEVRFNYSAVGDAVNLAARVESACKDVGFDIVVSGGTAEQAASLALLDAGSIRMKGKSEPQAIHLLLGDELTRQNPIFSRLLAFHNRFRAAQKAAQLDQAATACKEAIDAARPLGFDLDPFYLALLNRDEHDTSPRPEDIISASKQIMLSS